MWNTVLLGKNVTYLCFSIPQLFPTKVFLLRPCCGSSCSVHPTVVYVHTPKKSISQYQAFSSNIKKRKHGIDVLCTKLHDTLAYTAGKNKMIWVRPSVAENMCLHVSAARRQWDVICDWDRLRLLKSMFVLPLSAVYVSVNYRPNTDAVWQEDLTRIFSCSYLLLNT